LPNSKNSAANFTPSQKELIWPPVNSNWNCTSRWYS